MDALMPDSWAEPFNFCSDLVVVLDSNHRTIVHVNKQFVHEIAPAHRAVGLSFLTDLIQPSDRPAVETAMSNAFCPGVDYRHEKSLHVATSVCTLVLGVLGQYPIYRSYDWKFTKSEDDKFFLCLGRLVTVLNAERHKDEAEMMDFFDNAPIAMHWLGGTGNIIWANKKEMEVLGYTAEEYIGQPIAKFCPDEQELILNIFHNLGTGNSIHDVPVRFRKKDGRIQHLLIDSNVNWNVDGTFNHTRCFIRDDTERLVRETRLKLQQNQLEELAKTKEALLRKVIHEVRTPCHQIASNLDVLELEDSNNADNRSVFSSLRFAVQHLSDKMEDVGDILMLGDQMVKNFPQLPMNLHEGLTKFNDSFDWFQSSRVEFVKHIELKRGSEVLGNEHGIFRVLRILLYNSLQQTLDGRVVLEVSDVHTDGVSVSFTVSDTRVDSGQGANNGGGEEETSVWAVTSSDTNNLHEDGNALGLSLLVAKNYLLHMDSKLVMIPGLNSNVATFTLKLPMNGNASETLKTPVFYNMSDSKGYVAAELTLEAHKHFEPEPTYSRTQVVDSSEDEGPPSKAVGLNSDTTKSVLVVEDNKVSQMCAQRVLKGMKVLSDVAENGREAIDKLEAHPFAYDLVLMDIRMPVMDGLDCTVAIRKELKLQMPIIAFTAEHGAEMKQQCTSIGMDDFLCKPVNSKEFKTIISKYLGIPVK